MNRPEPLRWLPRFPASSGAGSADTPALMRILQILRRRKGIVIATTLLLMVAAVIAVTRLEPLYTSEAMIVLETQSEQALDIGAMVSGLPADVASVETEIEVMRSWGFAKAVVESLGLQNDPELNPGLKEPGPWSAIIDRALHWTDTTVFETTGWSPIVALGLAQPPALPPSAFGTQVVDSFRDRREVNTIGNSRAVSISYTADDPETAARVAQAIAERYIVQRLEGRFEATQRVTEWLNQRVGELRAEVEAKEAAVEAYRSANDLVSGERGVALVDEEISQLNAQLVEAQGARAEAEARLWQIQALMEQGAAASADAVLASPLIQGLRQEQARMQALVSEYSTRYSDEHPTMRDAQAQLANLTATIEREISKIAQGLSNTAAVARSREVALQEQLANIKGRIGTSNLAEVELRSLELDAQSARQLLEVFLQQFNASTTQEDIIAQQPDARIVSQAEIPESASFPATKAILALSLLSAFAVGIALALLRELLDNSFRSSAELEKETGIRVIGHVPTIENARQRRRGLADLVLRSPHAIEAESVRRICMAISLGQKRGLGNRIAFASAQPGEGKTSLSTSVARMTAKSNRRVLLIDADIHRPNVHSKLGLRRAPGLREVIFEDVALEDAVQQDERSGAWVLTAGRTEGGSTYGLFTSERLAELIEKAGKDYDLVVIDTAPVSAVADTLALSTLASTIFVVRWGGAPRRYVVSAVREIMEAGGHVMGAVLAQVDIASQLKYGTADAGGYMPEVRKYYAKT